MNRWRFPVLSILVVFSLCLLACESEELPGAQQLVEPEPQKAAMPEEHPPLMPPGDPQAATQEPEAKDPPAGKMKVNPHKVVVPESVKGKWRAVTLVVAYATGKTVEMEAPLGKVTAISDSDLSVETNAFMPSFFMDDKTITSVNNEPKNPAVKILVREGDAVVYEGWLFKNYPDIHPFEKDGLKLTLKSGVPTAP